ncbi:MAG: hypothetical protein KIS62_10900 [Ramlibacter sp.]|nr:hypothetical protein [Ramlibacter sp.]
MRFALATIATLISMHAVADGLPLVNGRYPGPVVVFELSSAQRIAIEHFRSCHLENFQRMNVYTPYVFELEGSQSAELKRRVGFSPRYFDVYQTYKGFNDAGPHWNLALQFAEDKIEIPLDLLLTERRAKRAQSVQRWKVTNPCFPHVGRK